MVYVLMSEVADRFTFRWSNRTRPMVACWAAEWRLRKLRPAAGQLPVGGTACHHWAALQFGAAATAGSPLDRWNGSVGHSGADSGGYGEAGSGTGMVRSTHRDLLDCLDRTNRCRGNLQMGKRGNCSFRGHFPGSGKVHKHMQLFDTQYRRLVAVAHWSCSDWSSIGSLPAQRLRAVDCGLQSVKISTMKVGSREDMLACTH